MSARSRAQAHAKHSHLCSCGAIVHGNGAKWNHHEMHERAGDGHRYLSDAQFCAAFPDYVGGKQKRRIMGPRPSCPPHNYTVIDSEGRSRCKECGVGQKQVGEDRG